MSLNVEQIIPYWDGDKDYKDGWKTYAGFEIDYGAEKLTQFETENLESLEWAKLRFSMLEKGIYSFQDSTNANFENMAKRYGGILDEVKTTKDELKDSIEQKLPDKIADAIVKSLKELSKSQDKAGEQNDE